MNRLKITFTDPYDWELGEKTNRTQSFSQAASLEGKINSQEEMEKNLAKPLQPVLEKPKLSDKRDKDGGTGSTNPRRSSAQRKKKSSVNDKKENNGAAAATKNGENEKTEESAPRSPDTKAMDILAAITDKENFVNSDIQL